MKKIILLLLISASLFCGYAQSAQKLTEVLSIENVTYGTASWFLAAQTGLIDDTKSEKEAFDVLSEDGWFNKIDAEADSKISLKNFAYLCTRAFNIKGGLMFRLTDAPRYAARELKAMKIISNDADVNASITGRQMINILTGCAYEREEAEK